MHASRVRGSVNGVAVDRDVPNRLTLAEFLRDELGLTGTKVSCELEVWGVCTVLVDGRPVSACTFLAVDIDGADVLTVEGLERDGELHPVQEAFIDEFAFQCGYCTPGFLMMSVALHLPVHGVPADRASGADRGGTAPGGGSVRHRGGSGCSGGSGGERCRVT